MLDKKFFSFESYIVGTLLFFFRIDNECSGCHSRHITIFTTNVDVDSLWLQLVICWVDLELVDIKIVSRLNQNRKRVIQERSVTIGSFLLLEFSNNWIIVKECLDSLLNLWVFNRLVRFDYFLYFFNDSWKSPLSELWGNFLIDLLSRCFNHIELISKLFQVNNLRALLLQSVKSFIS